MILSILYIYIILYIISVQFRQMLGLQPYLFSPATLRVSCWQRSRGPRLLPQNPSVSTVNVPKPTNWLITFGP